MGLTFVRTLNADELNDMAGRAPYPGTWAAAFATPTWSSKPPTGPTLTTSLMEVSFTADLRDCNRAIRNARLIESFTRKPAQAAIASVRNDRQVTEVVESGDVYWHQLEDRTPNPE